MPWSLDVLGRSDQVEWTLDDGQSLPSNLSQPRVVPDPATWPLRITRTGTGPIPDCTAGPRIGLVVVSAAFKALVEAFDPVTHHFIPLAIAEPGGTVSRDTHFLFKQGSFVADGIVPEASEVRVHLWKGEVSHYGATTLSTRLTWRASAVAGRHIWADRYLPAVNVVSDAFYVELRARNMGGFLAIEGRLDKAA